MLGAALDAAGLGRAVIGLGDADLYRQLLDELGVDGDAAQAILDRLAAHDLVGLEAEVDALEGSARARGETLLAPAGPARRPRGARRRRASSAARPSSAPTRAPAATYEGLAERGVADRVQLDLGLLRDLGYYTGAILEVYDPALGHVLGGGGRYDELMGRFGRAAARGRLRALPRAAPHRPGRGGAHWRRRASRERLASPARPMAREEGPLKLALPRGALFGETLDAARRGSASTPPSCAATRAR